jgi:hypothetical protein
MMMMISSIPKQGDANISTTMVEKYEDVRLVFQGLNRRWRIYRYDSSGNETFAPH